MPVVATRVALTAPYRLLRFTGVARGGQTANEACVVLEVGFLEVEHEVITCRAVAPAVVQHAPRPRRAAPFVVEALEQRAASRNAVAVEHMLNARHGAPGPASADGVPAVRRRPARVPAQPECADPHVPKA